MNKKNYDRSWQKKKEIWFEREVENFQYSMHFLVLFHKSYMHKM